MQLTIANAKDLPEAVLALPVLLDEAKATQIPGPRSGAPTSAYELTLKALVTPEDFHVITGCLAGHKLTVTLRVENQGAEL